MIDLHLHTNYSDGTDTVKELLFNASKNGVKVISITDHDSVDAYFELEDNYTRSLFSGDIIVGVELKAYYNGIPVEVLGYGIDYKKIRINKINVYEIQVKSLEELKKRARKLKLKFDENIYISNTEPDKRFASYVFPKELLKYDENKKILFSIGPEFDENSFYRIHTCNKNSIFYYDESKYGVSLKEVIDDIHNAGGIAVLAHPLIYPFDGKNKLDEVENILINYELDGIECEYPLFSEEERKLLIELAVKYNKYISGGTDYHAKTKPNIEIGTGINGNVCVTMELVSDWINKVMKI